MSELTLEIKALSRRLTKLCGGQESAMLIDGMPLDRHQTLSDYGNPKSDLVIRADVLALMEADCGQPLVTSRLARHTGHLLVKLPPGARDIVDLGRVTGRAMKEVGEVFAGLGQSLDDGVLSHVEGTDVAREIDEAIVMLATLKLMVEERVRRDAGGERR